MGETQTDTLHLSLVYYVALANNEYTPVHFTLHSNRLLSYFENRHQNTHSKIIITSRQNNMAFVNYTAPVSILVATI